MAQPRRIHERFQNPLDLLRLVDQWAAREPTVTAQSRWELMIKIGDVEVELEGINDPLPPLPRPLRHPEDEGPTELLDQVVRLLAAGMRGAPEQELRRACRAIRRKIRRLPEIQEERQPREPQLRHGAIMGAHRPNADQPTARERLRRDLDHDPWDD